MLPTLEAKEAYFRYNSAINAVLFDGRFAGAPLYLDIEGPICDDIARALDVSPSEFIEGLAKAVVNSLSWDRHDVFTWHTDITARWESAGRSKQPPFTALLCALSVAAERMRRDNQFEAHNYHQRLLNYLEITDDRAAQKLRGSFKATRPFWDELNRWLLDKEGELGRPTAQQVNGFPYVSYAISQALIRDAERQNLHEMFAHFCFAPGEHRAHVEMEVYLDQWIRMHRGTGTLNRLWRTPDLHERTASAACDELLVWDGAEAMDAQSGLKTYAPLWVCYIQTFPPPRRFFLQLTLPVEAGTEAGEFDASTCKDQTGTALLEPGTELYFSPMSDDGLASLEASKTINAAALLRDRFQITNKAATVRLLKNASALVCFIKADTSGLFREVSRLSLLQSHLVLCHKEWQGRVAKYLKDAARPGYTIRTSDTLRDLPADWVVFDGVEIVRLIDAPDDLLPLIPLAETSLEFQRGIRLIEDVWHQDAAPEVLAAASAGPLSLECAAEISGEKKIFAAAAAEDACVRLDLRDAEVLPTVPSTLSLYSAGRPLKQRRVVLSSADRPRSLGIFDYSLGFRLSPANVSGLVSAEPVSSSEGSELILSGLILNGEPEAAPPQQATGSDNQNIPSADSVEDFLHTAFHSDKPPEGQATCAIRGYHIWHCQPHEAHQSRWEGKWAQCKTCGKKYFARNRGRRRNEPAPIAAARALPPPAIPAYQEVRPSIDTVYDALCYLGGGKYPRFAEICGHASEKPYFVMDLTSNLSALGHIDLHSEGFSGAPSAWRCAPPSATLLHDNGALLSGFRSKELLSRIAAAAEAAGGRLDRIDQENGPAACLVRGLDKEQLQRLFSGVKDPHQRPLALVDNPASTIAQHAAPISRILTHLPEVYIRAGEPVQRFEPASARWIPASDTLAPGGYRTISSRKYVFRNRDGSLRQANYRIVKLLAANSANVRLHGYLPQKKEFRCTFKCEPPPLLERALVACSGFLPRISQGLVTYTNVGPEVAYPVLDRLYG